MLPSRTHSHITILTSWWIFRRVGGGSYGLIFGQMGSNGQSHVGGGLWLQGCAAKAQGHGDRQTADEGGEEGGGRRDLEADTHCEGKSLTQAPTSPAGRLSEGDVHVPMGVDPGRKDGESAWPLGWQLDSRRVCGMSLICPQHPLRNCGGPGLFPTPPGTSSTARLPPGGGSTERRHRLCCDREELNTVLGWGLQLPLHVTHVTKPNP